MALGADGTVLGIVGGALGWYTLTQLGYDVTLSAGPHQLYTVAGGSARFLAHDDAPLYYEEP